MIQLQHLGEKRLGGLGEGQKRQKGKEREKKRTVSSLVQFVCAKAL